MVLKNRRRAFCLRPHHRGTTMEQYAGIDVSLDSVSVCIVEVQGKIVKEAKVACEPEALITWLAAHGTPMARIGLEAGPLSQWLFAGLKAAVLILVDGGEAEGPHRLGKGLGG